MIELVLLAHAQWPYSHDVPGGGGALVSHPIMSATARVISSSPNSYVSHRTTAWRPSSARSRARAASRSRCASRALLVCLAEFGNYTSSSGFPASERTARHRSSCRRLYCLRSPFGAITGYGVVGRLICCVAWLCRSRGTSPSSERLQVRHRFGGCQSCLVASRITL